MKKIILLSAALFGAFCIANAQNSTLTGFYYNFTSTATGTDNCLYNLSGISGIVYGNGDGINGSKVSIDTDKSLKIISDATLAGIANAGSQKSNGFDQNPLVIDLYKTIGTGPSASCAAIRGNINLNMANNKKVKVVARASEPMNLRIELGTAFASATNQNGQVFEMSLSTTNQAFTFDYNGKFGAFDSTNINVIRLKFNVGTNGGVSTGFTGTVNIAEIQMGSAFTTTTGVVTTAGLFFNEDNYSHLVSVYPNPATENITVDMTSLPGSNSVKLVNAQGAVLSEQNAIGYANFNLQGLTKGLYIVQIFSDNKVVRKKVMVE